MPETKAALIVANWTYEDSDLRQLSAPANDAEALARVLRDPRLCGFEVTTLLNRPSREACEQIERFFIDRKRDDLLLLYFSCHGIKDDDGLLYFAAPDTRLIEHSRPLRSTALSADFVRSVMRASNSRRQVLMLDCCYSGAFAGAMLSKGDKSVGVRDQFEQGRGMVVMTASDALQYSFEGDSVAGQAVNSIFTRVLVRGIETGEADHDRDGTISLDELYDYVYDRVVRENPNQRPKKWDLGVEGRIIVAQTAIVRSSELQPDLAAAVTNSLSFVRLGAVAELAKLLNGPHKGLAAAAREALEKLAGDDSRQVSAAAEAALGKGTVPADPPVAARPPAPPPVVPTPHAEPVRSSPPRSAPSPKPVPPPAPPQQAPAARTKRAPEEKKVAPSKARAAVPSAPPLTRIPQRVETPSAQPPAESVPATHSAPWMKIVAGLLVFAFAAFMVYRALTKNQDTGTSTTQQQQGETQSEKNQSKPSVTTPVVLERPPFDYTYDGAQAEDTRLRLSLVGPGPNPGSPGLPTFTVPNAFRQEQGNVPSQIPTQQGGFMLVKAIRNQASSERPNGEWLLCIYGRNFAEGRFLTAFNLKSGKVEFAFDFSQYVTPPKYVEADREFVNEAVKWAQVKGNILYVSTAHSTYAKSSYGQNAYLTAIDIKTGRLLWQSQPLVSNSSNFLLHRDAIISGYGFTQEPHFLYVLNQKDGRVVQTLPTRKSVDTILNEGDTVYVHTYDQDLVYKASEQPARANVKD
jgi:uncharacterized caspase-like protein